MVSVTDCFHAALSHSIKTSGHGSQKEIAAKAGIKPNYLNNILKKRREGSEDVRRAIAAAFGRTYEDFLKLGRSLLSVNIQRETGIIPLPGGDLPTNQEISKEIKIAPAEQQAQPATEEPFSMAEMLAATARVLESKTVYRSALASNIRAFDKAVKMEAQVEDLMKEMREMKEMMKTIIENQAKQPTDGGKRDATATA